ncbi:hypothetical protein D3C81_1657430 [compost metagenome]
MITSYSCQHAARVVQQQRITLRQGFVFGKKLPRHLPLAVLQHQVERLAHVVGVVLDAIGGSVYRQAGAFTLHRAVQQLLLALLRLAQCALLQQTSRVFLLRVRIACHRQQQQTDDRRAATPSHSQAGSKAAYQVKAVARRCHCGRVITS